MAVDQSIFQDIEYYSDKVEHFIRNHNNSNSFKILQFFSAFYHFHYLKSVFRDFLSNSPLYEILIVLCSDHSRIYLEIKKHFSKFPKYLEINYISKYPMNQGGNPKVN